MYKVVVYVPRIPFYIDFVSDIKKVGGLSFKVTYYDLMVVQFIARH
jgi:hypothetical protein